MCDYIYEDGPRKGLKYNIEHCEFHNHVIFSNKSGLFVSWIATL